MKQSSRVKIRACRLNGALSHGPITEAGKRRSAVNTLYHGCYSRQVVLPQEPRKAFDALLKQHVEDLQPRNTAELALVHDMAAARWRQRRIWHLEKQIMDENAPPQQYAWNEEIPDKPISPDEIPDVDSLIIHSDVVADRFDDAFVALLSNRKLQTLQQLDCRLQGLYERSLHRLLAMQNPKKGPRHGKNQNFTIQPT
jgi:hypothetical protein